MVSMQMEEQNRAVIRNGFWEKYILIGNESQLRAIGSNKRNTETVCLLYTRIDYCFNGSLYTFHIIQEMRILD